MSEQSSEFYLSCRNNKIEKVKEYLTTITEDEINRLEPNGSTALHAASYNGHDDIVRLLLDKGASTTLKNRYGYTAEQEAKTDTIKELFQQRKKAFIVNKITNQKYPLNGVKLDPNGVNDEPNTMKFGSIPHSAAQLPPIVDLRKDCTTVENQRQINSCVGNALAGAYEYLIKKETGKEIDISRLFIYYNARANRSQNIRDDGCYISDAIQTLKTKGVCKEDYWPYNLVHVNTKPSSNAYKEASPCIVQDREGIRLKADLQQMKQSLSEGYPFTFGLLTYDSFAQSAHNGGHVLMPSQKDKQRGGGGHCMLAVGYNDMQQKFIVRNSYGTDWGDKGYLYIPYEYMSNPYYNQDIWVIRKIAQVNPVQHQAEEKKHQEYVINNSWFWNVESNWIKNNFQQFYQFQYNFNIPPHFKQFNHHPLFGSANAAVMSKGQVQPPETASDDDNCYIEWGD
ncbi:unnamed protein product [Didymodactylos carnosus]|uniref:Peptidase C1A papain C-terminal domain-containing protein n=1 Tax=Didymodactylos carnosus TaxID=1234261 RepID=A0A815T010_9BILA|nr:unnamed protein product [Didymodactylos carnosus]CAF1496515.1 unnamed protein product [Didymodactylos carnosus]CAF3891757.1 unnamed protein product [Didymodactylos carnosus]CAF4358923.1 unnamed protein product [Didymodactylos carnosus]